MVDVYFGSGQSLGAVLRVLGLVVLEVVQYNWIQHTFAITIEHESMGTAYGTTKLVMGAHNHVPGLHLVYH